MKRGGVFVKGKWSYFVTVLVLLVAFVYATQVSTVTQGNFNNGTYADVFYNLTNNFVQLNISESKSSGNYNRQIKPPALAGGR